MSEPTEDADYRLVAREVYEKLKGESLKAQEYGSQLARWLLASLVLVNGGALVGLFNHLPASRRVLIASGWSFTAGIACAILCGTVAWMNAGIRDIAYDDSADPKMLVSIDHWPKAHAKRERGIVITYWASLTFGIGALVCFLRGVQAVAGNI